MSKHSKNETAAGTLTLSAATEDVARATKIFLEANNSVADAMEAWPSIMRHRSIIAEMLPPRNISVQDEAALNDGQRADIQHRLDFKAAVDHETKARGDLIRAERVRDQLQRAADIVALGDGRAALAEAIRKAAEADRELAAHDAATAAVSEVAYSSYNAIEQAELAVQRAPGEAADYARAQAAGRAGGPPKSVRQAGDELQVVKDAQAAARALRDTLEAQRPPIAGTARYAHGSIDDAARQVVRASPEVRAAVAAFQAANREFLRLLGVVDTLKCAGALPEGFDPSVLDPAPSDKPGAAAWVTALTALPIDAAAPLPEVP